MSKKAAVYAADDLSLSVVLYHDYVADLDSLVSLKRAEKVGPRSYRLAPIMREKDFGTVYDRASSSGARVMAKSPWKIWMFHFQWNWPLEHTNGWPLRMRCGLMHQRDEKRGEVQ